MNEMWRDDIARLDGITKECGAMCCLTIDSELQRAACERLRAMGDDCAAVKLRAIAARDEEFANLVLGFECIASCLHDELMMWILLKENKPDDAWDMLVDSQMAATGAARAHDQFSHVVEHVARLEQIEKLIFPPQTFVSAGLTVEHQECSLCGSVYGECEHLASKPYWGQFCCIITSGIKADHVAVVKNPADKGCRITDYTVEGGERHLMTRKVNPRESKPGEPSQCADLDVEGPDGVKPMHARVRFIRSRN